MNAGNGLLRCGVLSGPDRQRVGRAVREKEALRQILKTDFASILLDIRMPKGRFRTANIDPPKLKRSRHNPESSSLPPSKTRNRYSGDMNRRRGLHPEAGEP